MRTVIYVRLSVHRGATDPSTSPEGQEAACRAHCAAQGWDVGDDDVVRDLDVSGAAGLDRPGLQRLREIGAQRVVFLKLDRISRNVADFHALSKEFTLVSVKDNLDLGSATGRFVATILAAFAEMEREMVRERVKDARAVLHSQGRFAGGRIPHGYQVVDNPNGNGKVLAPHPDEAALWATVAEGIVAGRSLRAQTRYLIHKGITGRKGEALVASTVREVLLGEAIVGRKHGVQIYEPAMDLELWARLRSVFDARKLPEGRRRGKNLRMLAPVMTCATCEAPMWMSSDRGKLFARCSTNIHKLRVDDKCPTPASVKYDNLEALVLDLIEDEAKERPVVVMQRPGSDPMAVRSAEDALEAAQARLRAAQTEEEEADALSSRRAARATLEALSNATGAPVLRLTGERVWDVLMGEDIDAAARAMQQVLDRVVVTPGGGRGRKTLDPARVSLEWADYVEPGPTKPRTLTRGGKIVNQAELDRYAQATAEGV